MRINLVVFSLLTFLMGCTLTAAYHAGSVRHYQINFWKATIVQPGEDQTAINFGVFCPDPAAGAKPGNLNQGIGRAGTLILMKGSIQTDSLNDLLKVFGSNPPRPAQDENPGRLGL